MITDPLLLASIAAGICFFGWPLRMNQSGLSAVSSTFVYAVVAFAVAVIGMWVVPAGWTELRGRALRIGAEAAALNAMGILVFTYLLARATTTEAPRAILIVITTQTALTGAWAAYQAGGVQPRVLGGLATALATVILLHGGR
jgi:hypothetical protein